MLKFSIPYLERGELEITICTNSNPYEYFYLEYSKYNKQLKIPSNIKSFSFNIENGNSRMNHSVEGLYYGVLFYTSPDYRIENNTNYIEIKIPAINGAFFDTYYVKGEYARLVDDCIIWKGDVYKRLE